MSVFLDRWDIEIQFSEGEWTNVTNDVISADTIGVEYGINDNGPTDRVATTGKLTFSLNNSNTNSYGLAGLYSPGYVSCRSGFAPGAIVRLCLTYDGIMRCRFYGRIAPDGIRPSPGIYGSRRTEVTVLDWMNQAGTHELELPAYATNKRIDEVVPLIIANMPLAPLATEYHTGQDTFKSIFDSVGAKTRALSEFQKLALSEYGFIYVRHGKKGQEVLVVEDRNAKITNNTLTNHTIHSSQAGRLLKEDGGYLLTESGDKLILEIGTPSTFADSGVNPDISIGKHFANVVTCTNYPRRYDTEATVLFDQPSYYTIAAQSTITGYKCNYRDPEGGAWHVAGMDMQVPVAGSALMSATTISFGTPNLIIDSTGRLAGFGTGQTININCVGGTGSWNNGDWVIATAGAGTLAIGTAESGNKTLFASGAGSVTTIMRTNPPSDYIMYADTEGIMGTVLTANLTVTANYGANAVEYTLANAATVTGYITKLQARGKGIYLYYPIDYTVQDEASKGSVGSHPLSIEMSYQDQALISKTIAAGELNVLKLARKELDKWYFYANRDENHMMAFMDIDIGDRVHFTETQTALDEDRFIDAVEFDITDGMIIKAGLKTRAPMTYGAWLVGITGATELEVTTILA